VTDWRRPPGGDDVWLPIGLAVLVVGGALAGAAYLFEQGGKELHAAAVKASAPAKPAPVQAAPSAAPAAPPVSAVTPPSGAVFRCLVGGRVEYRDAPCERGGRQVDVAASSGVRLADPRAVAVAVAAPSPAAAEESAVTTAVPVARNRAECDALARQIAGIQASARQPHSPTYQDYLRDQLAKAKSGWAELKCHGPIE
jgi:hypothetical protein